MAEKRKRSILIIARTYPELSRRHRESACTAGVFLDTGDWCRIYPLPARYLEKNVARYDVISALVWRNDEDPRPESFKIDPGSIQKIDHISTGKGSPPNWQARANLVLREDRCFESVEHLKAKQKELGTSLGMISPRPGARTGIEKRPESDRAEWEKRLRGILHQSDLFDKPKELQYLSSRIVVRFHCLGNECTTEHKCGVLDWEICELARRDGFEAAKEKLRTLLNNDIYETRFMVGNFRTHLESFGIVGLWYPKRSPQLQLL